MADATALPEQLVRLIIRFTAAVPDFPLSIQHTPRLITTLSLKQLIRQHLPPHHASARLRLIYAGKVLADTDSLSKSLRLPPPRRDRRHDEDDTSSKNKGKQFLRDSPGVGHGTTSDTPQDARKYYIHCSLGDALTPSELAAEAALAQSTEDALKAKSDPSKPEAARRRASEAEARRRSSTTTAPSQPQAQGFDRLLSSGFTQQEVASLRSHFQTNLSFTHTPDTMPSPAQMRVLEDQWLDSSATDPSPALAGEGGDNGWGAGFAVEEGGLDDMLWGYMTGFFWPLGALVWGFREDGVWSRRRQLAVVMGVLINTIFGFMRWSA